MKIIMGKENFGRRWYYETRSRKFIYTRYKRWPKIILYVPPPGAKSPPPPLLTPKNPKALKTPTKVTTPPKETEQKPTATFLT